MTDLQRLRAKLCRELAQSEHDARIHTTREADRLGRVAPAEQLRAIAAHAEQLRPRLEAVVGRRQPIGLRLGRAVGGMFSAMRHWLIDRALSGERSYRATLLGLRHGLDAARLLREVARREGLAELFELCDQLITERTVLLGVAERALTWFAVHPELAVQSGHRLAASSSVRET